MDKSTRDLVQQWKKEDLLKHRIIYQNSVFGKVRISHLFSEEIEISEGGWYNARKWMTAQELVDAETRWVKGSYETGKEQPDYKDWIAHQCGGCRTFAALDSDYGICCNKASPNDGKIVFEHGGCKEHSDFERK